MKIGSKFGFLMALAAGVFWGSYGTFTTILADMGLGSNTISLISPLFAMLLFFVFVLADSPKKLLVRRGLLPVLLVYGLLSALFNYSLVRAYIYLPIAIVSTIVFCNLFLIMVFSYFLFHDKMTWQKCVAITLAIFGIAMVLNVFSLEWTFSLTGILWTLAATFSWAVMVTGEKFMLNHDVDGNAIMMYQGFFSVLFISLLASPWQAIVDLAAAITATGGRILLPVLGLGVVTTIGCFYLYINALKRLEAAYAQLGFVMDPLTASILGFLVFGQALLPIQIAGIALILLVVSWVQWGETRKKEPIQA